MTSATTFAVAEATRTVLQLMDRPTVVDEHLCTDPELRRQLVGRTWPLMPLRLPPSAVAAAFQTKLPQGEALNLIRSTTPDSDLVDVVFDRERRAQPLLELFARYTPTSQQVARLTARRQLPASLIATLCCEGHLARPTDAAALLSRCDAPSEWPAAFLGVMHRLSDEQVLAAVDRAHADGLLDEQGQSQYEKVTAFVALLTERPHLARELLGRNLDVALAALALVPWRDSELQRLLVARAAERGRRENVLALLRRSPFRDRDVVAAETGTRRGVGKVISADTVAEADTDELVAALKLTGGARYNAPVQATGLRIAVELARRGQLTAETDGFEKLHRWTRAARFQLGRSRWLATFADDARWPDGDSDRLRPATQVERDRFVIDLDATPPLEVSSVARANMGADIVGSAPRTLEVLGDDVLLWRRFVQLLSQHQTMPVAKIAAICVAV